MDEYISKQSVLDYLNRYLDSIGECGADSLLFDRGQRRALINSIQDIIAIKPADVQIVDRWVNAQINPPIATDGKTSDYVLVLRTDSRQCVCYYVYNDEGNYWCSEDEKSMYDLDKVTHWQPLPESPKGSDTEEPTEVSMPDGNCLDCKFQYLEDSDYWCSICPGNPEDV